VEHDCRDEAGDEGLYKMNGALVHGENLLFVTPCILFLGHEPVLRETFGGDVRTQLISWMIIRWNNLQRHNTAGVRRPRKAVAAHPIAVVKRFMSLPEAFLEL
jgi:hypothetical protein